MFSPFKSATKRETPGFLEAEIARARYKQQAKQQANALRSQNAVGAASLYNAGMGDNTPIADYLSEQMSSGVPIDQTAALETGTITPEGSATAQALRAGGTDVAGAAGGTEAGLAGGSAAGQTGVEAALADAGLAEAGAAGAEALGADVAGTAGAEALGAEALGAAGAEAAAGAGAGAASGAGGIGAGLAAMTPAGWAALLVAALAASQ
jgi:hypothetical protein